ncbi:MAG TPA: hypothetical protein VM661_12875 [Candidatus Sulfotelmatobacter sp.]|jgi:hypothetical protein|nr:hypothetical protein [Candidatus Sulfotelmatobacter sp.]
MKIFNMSPWVILAVLLGAGMVVGLGVGGYSFRNTPSGMHGEFAVNPSEFLTVDAALKINGQPADLHGVVRCRVNPYPGLSDQEDFSFPDALVKDTGSDRQVILVVRSVCSEYQDAKTVLHFTVIDRRGDDATVYLTDSPQLAGSSIKVSATRAADWDRNLDGYLDNCDEDGFINTGRIGVWHKAGESFAGDMVSVLGPPPPSLQIEGVSNFVDTSIGDRAITGLLRDWKVRSLSREDTSVCADNSTFVGKGCLARVTTRLQAYALGAIDGGNFPTIRVNNGVMQLAEQGVVRLRRTSGSGYAHNMHLALRSGERYFYVQRMEVCYARVWRPD